MHDTGLEWLEADGLGGFASGTVAGQRTRRYHGLLCAARTPPTGRVLLVAAVEPWIDLGPGPVALASHRYLPDTTHPDGWRRLRSFAPEPWPTWSWELAPGLRVVQELFVPRGLPAVVLSWRLEGRADRARLTLRPLLALRDVHALRREDRGLDLVGRVRAHAGGQEVRWQPDVRLPAVLAVSSARYHAGADWYRNFLYEEERARGYDHVEDLASPGFFEQDLAQGEAFLALGAEDAGLPPLELVPPGEPLSAALGAVRTRERERRADGGTDDRAAEAYLVRRGAGHSLIAGYPWFTDWGRDTFIALRGLLLARGQAAQAASILAAWAGHVSQGMLPNRFPDSGATPGASAAEYNSVDASLWFVTAVAETLAALPGLAADERAPLEAAVLAILAGYARGTRYGIHADGDGLLACGEAGTQLTWMDAKVGDLVMTPRIGKPVEVQALWVNALDFGAGLEPRYARLAEQASSAFLARFWDDERGYLLDVVDCDHVSGDVDRALRPNQILAVGGLPRALLDGPRARRVVDRVERELWTPLGLRTLAPDDPRYQGRYEGGPLERDRAYHQGTAWPWLLGPFVEAWVRVRGRSPEALREARERFLSPLHVHLRLAGLGHVSEIADGDPPHAPRGCPFQAWSLGEFLRLERSVLRPD